MPERKGRKRRPDGRRHENGGGTTPQAPVPAPRSTISERNASPRRADPLVPSNTARMTGLMIAVVTAFLAILMIRDAATGGSAGIDAIVRIAAGVSLVVLAVVVGALSAFPVQIRRRIRGK